MIALSLAGCMNDSATSLSVKQNAELFAQELEASKDPVQVMDAYITYFQQDMGLMFHEIADACQYMGMPYYTAKYDPQKCAIAEALAEPGTMYNCINAENQSDECILYRRNRHSTQVAYFDYKRFLGNDTRIKDDATFIRFAQAYADIAKCETALETTSAEKQECKERQEKFFRQAIKQKIHCRNFAEKDYRELLIRTRINYQYLVKLEHRTHSEAIKSLKKDKIDAFAKDYMCDTSGWQQDFLHN